MNKSYPNKWVRKAVFEAINGIGVDGHVIYAYDSFVTGVNRSDHYIILSTQTTAVDKNNKCEWFWESNINIEVNTNYILPGSPGTRLLADNIMDAVRANLNNLTLDGSSGLTIIKQTQNFPADFVFKSGNTNTFQSNINLQLLIK